MGEGVTGVNFYTPPNKSNYAKSGAKKSPTAQSVTSKPQNLNETPPSPLPGVHNIPVGKHCSGIKPEFFKAFFSQLY